VASANDGYRPSHKETDYSISPEGASYANMSFTFKKLYTHRFQHQANDTPFAEAELHFTWLALQNSFVSYKFEKYNVEYNEKYLWE
jgi:hypothetical protein